MVSPLTESEKVQILDLHYSGNSNDEIHNITGKSTGSISGVITKHVKSLESQDHNSIISQSRIWKKNNLSLNDASNAIRVYNILKKNGIDIDDLPDISKIFSYIDEKKITLSEFVDSSKQLRDIQKKSDIPLCDVPQKISEQQNEYDSLRDKSTKLKKDIVHQEKLLQDSIESKNTTQKQLDTFTEITGYMIKSNIDVKNFEKLGNMLKSADAQKYNLSEIVANLEKENSISNRITDLQSKQKELSDEIESKKETITKKHSEASKLDSKYKAICKDHDKKKKEIADIESLSKSGVSSSDIKSWDKIISNTSLDISKLAENTNVIKQLSDTIQSLKENIKSLKKEKASQQGKKEQLHIQVKKLESKQNELLKLDEKIKQMVSDANSYVLANTHSLSQKILTNHSNDAKELFSQLEQKVNQLTSQLEQRTNELLVLNEKIIQQAKMISDVEFLLPIYKAITGDKVPKSNVLTVFSNVVSGMINWCILEKISHTAFAKSLTHTNESIRPLFSGTRAA